MDNRAQNVIKQIEIQCSKNFCDELFKKVGSLEDNATPKTQGDFIKACLNEINAIYGPEVSEKIMRPCGYNCISNATISRAKKLFNEAANVEEFLGLLNQNGFGGGHLHIESGNVIGVYSTCYCGIPKTTKDMPIEYCECSAGWFEKLFSSTLGKNVKVKRMQTILSGGESCIFVIEAAK